MLKKDILDGDKFDFWNEVVDIGDFVEIQGTFSRPTGEKTIEAKDWRMLKISPPLFVAAWTRGRGREILQEVFGYSDESELRNLF